MAIPNTESSSRSEVGAKTALASASKRARTAAAEGASAIRVPSPDGTYDERYRYNPQFQMTKEVESIMREFYDDLLAEYDGTVKFSDVQSFFNNQAEGTSQLTDQQWDNMKTKHLMHEPNPPLSFEQFCSLLLAIRDVAPRALESVYLAWLNEQHIDVEESRVLHTRQSVNKSPDLLIISKSLIAGGLAGAVAKTSVAPFDRVKILFQVSKERFSLKKAFIIGRSIVQRDGVTALWRGNLPTVLRILPYAGIQHASYDQFKRLLFEYNRHSSRPDELTNVQRVLAGGLAGVLSVSCTYPLDVMRARLAVMAGRKTSLYRSALDMIEKDGFNSLFRGMGPSVLGVFLYGGIAFALNEFLKKEYVIVSQAIFPPANSAKEGDKDSLHYLKLPTIAKLICGGISGLVSQSVTYPLDVIRRRQQTAGYVTHSVRKPGMGEPAVAAEYMGMIKTAKVVIEEEGFRRGLFKGLSMNWIKGPIAIGISLTAYDVFKELLHVETKV